jgi:hypothetical protein
MNDMNKNTENLSHETARRALETLFVGEDGDEAFREVPAWQLHRHLAGCEVCRRQYDASALADRFLSSSDSTEQTDLRDLEPAGFERSFAEASFLGALDNMLDEEQASADQDHQEHQDHQASQAHQENVVDLSSERSARQVALRRFSAAAAVLLVGAASWLAFDQSQNTILPGGASSDDSQFQARTAAATDTYGPFEAPELEIFCTERTPEGLQFTGTKDAPFGLLGCPLDAEIKLAYKNSSPKLHYAAFFGVDQTGKILWYGPTPADPGAVGVDQTSELSPVGEAIRLEVNHEPGGVRVFGLFSPEPVDFVALRQTVDGFDRQRLFDGEAPGEMGMRGVLTSNTFKAVDADAIDAETSTGGKR